MLVDNHKVANVLEVDEIPQLVPDAFDSLTVLEVVLADELVLEALPDTVCSSLPLAVLLILDVVVVVGVMLVVELVDKM